MGMAVERFRIAAEQGHFKAFCNLKKATEDGNSNAQFYLARIYQHGGSKGIVQKGDDSKAMKWYQLASQQGNSRAQYHLDLMLLKQQGRGSVQNSSKNMLVLEDPRSVSEWCQ